MRTMFNEQLETLDREMLRMGSLCEEVIALAAKALITENLNLAHKIAPLTEQLVQGERDAERLCMQLLLRQQPVAADLRHISAALKMITDMERIGVQAEDIAEIELVMEHSLSNRVADIHEMARAAIEMVTESVEAFVRQDVRLAEKVICSDDVVDAYFVSIKNALIELIGKSAQNGEEALDLLMIAKYFERIGDHAVNIAEWVLYGVTGRHSDA